MDSEFKQWLSARFDRLEQMVAGHQAHMARNDERASHQERRLVRVEKLQEEASVDLAKRRGIREAMATLALILGALASAVSLGFVKMKEPQKETRHDRER